MGKFKFGKWESKFGSTNFKFGLQACADVLIIGCNILIDNKKSFKRIKASETFIGLSNG